MHSVTRRAFVASAGASLAGCGTTAPPVQSPAAACVAPGSGATFILVHGSWVGAWTYQDLDRRLTARGHVVYRPALSGWGERAHLARPEMNVDTNIEDVCALIDLEELSDVVLVGHSYGGMVITGVADRMPDRIASIVYLDAFLPEDGMSIADYAGEDWRALCEGVLAQGEFLLPPPVFLLDPDAAATDEQLAKSTPAPVRQQLQRIALTGAHQRVAKKAYVHATRDAQPYFREAYERASDRARADASWTTYAVPSGHLIYEEMPERTIEILEASI